MMKVAKLVVVLVSMFGAVVAQAQNPAVRSDAGAGLRPVAEASKPPPPTIADLVLLLKSYAPDLARTERLRAELARPIAESGAAVDLARAWHGRAQVAEELGDAEQRLEALNKALANADAANASPRDELGTRLRIRQDLNQALQTSQGLGAGIDASEKFVADYRGSNPGAALSALAGLSNYYVAMGSLERARKAIAEAEAMANSRRSNRGAAANYAGWAAAVERARGTWLLAQGKHEEAERAFEASLRWSEENVSNKSASRAAGLFGATQQRTEIGVDQARRDLAHAYLAQLRLDEAELLLREVLKSSLLRDGRNSRMVGVTLMSLGRVFRDRGRYAEALVIVDWAERSFAEAGFPPGSLQQLSCRKQRAALLTSLGRYVEAAALFDELQKLAAAEARQGEILSVTTLNAVVAYLAVDRIADALAAGDRILAEYVRSYGADHYYSAEARAYRAMALRRSGRVAEARREFERAMAVLVDPGKVLGKQQASAASSSRLRSILNAYLVVLAGSKSKGSEKDIAEAFRIADVARWQSVQKAISGSALRAAAGTPELGARIKTVQDADDELEALFKNLISQRSAPPDKQLPAVIAGMEARIAALQKQQQGDLAEIRRQFPQYDALVSPRPADLATARKALRPNEALLSIYVTPGGSYVWATAADGALHFHFSTQNRAWVAAMVKRLRDSVDLSAAAGPEQMRFDLEAAAALYQELLAPVEGAWDQADTLLVVANDALGQIPFSLLPTANVPSGKAEPGLPLAQLRQTPWLVRKLAVAYVPSIAALVTLRALPPIQGQRDAFIGFGDPDFGAGAARVSEGSVSRGLRHVRKLTLSRAPKWDENAISADAMATPFTEFGTPLLMPLPDTRDEILAIGTALAANMPHDTFFGAQANRGNVVAADLRHRRVIAFATHGLVAGDLPGLDQPALALAPPNGKGIDDGLLKLEDILRLSLEADLVVLSACNTAAADGAGAEAVSGLGRGFFYAGARAVLATHWPVETVSARELVTHLFERYARDGKLSRALALRQAMLEMIDRGVSLDERGKPEYSYAHPAFWAPYALYGDPGR